MLYVTGDTHGERQRLLSGSGTSRWQAGDTVLICGDFGYLFLNDAGENAFLDALEQCPFTVCFLDGNHENFPVICAYPEERWNGGRIHRIRKNVIHLMRGQVFTIEGKTFFTMGGAYSMDRALRQRDVSYWEEELPCDADYDEALKNLFSCDYRVDFILTHTAPQTVLRIMGITPDPHDARLTGFFDQLFATVSFRHWYCGHLHEDRDVLPEFSVVWFREIPLL